jgi:hypothetical protein
VSSFVRKLFVTIAVPSILIALASYVRLPGVPEISPTRSVDPAVFSVFSLGILPILTAYQIVEVIAFLVPRLSRMRHVPEGRAKLDVAARVLALVLALVQGVGVAQSINSLSASDASDWLPHVSTPLVTFSLVGGVCIYFVAARFVTRFGLVNGFVLFAAAGALKVLATEVVHLDDPRTLAFGAAALAAVIAASFAALFRAGSIASASEAPAADGPYRSARALVVRPWVPIPSSSFAAYFVATSILMFPATLANFGVPGMSALQLLLSRDDSFFTPIALVTIALVAVALAFFLHRPREMADLASRVGAAPGTEREARAVLVKSLLPTFLWFAVLLLSGQAANIGMALVPLFVAVAMDLVASARDGIAHADGVVVWEERRASAVPVLRAALASHGVPSRARGMAVLSLWQVFAPYAPCEIVVAKDDAERATRVLRHLVCGEEAPPLAESTSAAAPKTESSWSLPRRTGFIGAALAAVLVTIVGAHFATRAPADDAVASGPPARLEIIRVDDSIDVFGPVRDQDLPEGEGLEIFRESTHIGPNRRSENVHFARCTLRQGESRDVAARRFRTWLDTVNVPADAPAGARLAMQDVVEVDEDTQKASLVALRTYVLVGEPVLSNADVETADVALDKQTREPYVAVKLTNEGAKKFETVTEEWVDRRLAIVLDGQVESAPMIRTKIAGGRLSITMGHGDPEKQLADAKRLERALNQRRRR